MPSRDLLFLRHKRGDAQFPAHLLLDPWIRASKPFLQRNLWLPAENLAQTGVVGVAAAHSLRPGHMPLNAGNTGDDTG